MTLDMMEPLTQFGVAGLMGALWVWERLLSRKRERQLSQAHDRLMQTQLELNVLIDLVRRNTEAIEGFERTQGQLNHLLEKMHDQIGKRAA